MIPPTRSRYGGVVAILVDDARWPWRDTYWCHLVSDSALEELHSFAARLGCRRIGFQGDHYDIDVDTRAEALLHGAIACTSRQLVRSLRSAGLRLRPSSFAKWELEQRWQPLDDPSELIASTASLRADQHDLLRTLATDGATGAFALRRSASIAAVVYGSGTPPPVTEHAAGGRHVRIDRLGQWSVELVHPPLSDAE